MIEFSAGLYEKESLIYVTSGRIKQEETTMTLHSEIFEQPERLAALLENQKQTVYEIAKAIK